MEWRRLNLREIEATLHRLPLASLGEGEASGAMVIRRLLSGYAYLDDLLGARVDIFAYGGSRHILELNHRVLCGVTPARRQEFRDHIEATESWFYDDPGAGISRFSEWHRLHASRPALVLAAGVLIQTVSTPQLFIEGNRRTGALLASYVLARAGHPPMVVGAEDIAEYDACSLRAAALHRAGLIDTISAWLLVHRLVGFLRATANPRLLAPLADTPLPSAPRPASLLPG